MRLRRSGRSTLRKDLGAGALLGMVSVPDGLASGLLAGLNPVAGLYGNLFGTLAGALTASSVFMSVQATGAMAVILADVPVVSDGPDAGPALVTLGMLTGVFMLAAGLLRLGPIVRFRAECRTDWIHQRGGRQHHSGAAVGLHRLRLLGTEPHRADL